MNKDPYVFEGPFAITPDVLWLVFYRTRDAQSRAHGPILQNVVLADADTGHVKIAEVYSRCQELIFCVSLAQLYRARSEIQSSSSHHSPAPPPSLFEKWMPSFQREFIMVYRGDQGIGVERVCAFSAVQAMSNWGGTREEMLVSCGSEADISQSIEALQVVFDGDLGPVGFDLRDIPNRPVMWLYTARSPSLRQFAVDIDQEIAELSPTASSQ